MKTIWAVDYGILPNVEKDYTQLFILMFEENLEDTVFILEKGRYRFSALNAIQDIYYLSNTDVQTPRYVSMRLQKMKNIVLDGGGSEFIYEGQTIPIVVDESENVVIKNLTIDWDIPLGAEGEITRVGEGWTEIKIDETKYPHVVKDHTLYFQGESWEEPYQHFCEFNKTTGKVAYDTGDAFRSCRQEQIETGIIRFYGEFDTLPTVGNFGVIRHNRRLHSGIFLNKSKAICIQDITLYNTGGLGILSQFCEHLRFNYVRFEPNKRKGRRFVSGHDDGLHCSNNRGEIQIKNCYFYGLMDDPVNVHGTTLKITELIDDYVMRGVFVHEQAVGFTHWAEEGHEIAFINHMNMASLGKGHVRSFELLSPNEFMIAFTSPIPNTFKVGDALENLTNTPSLTCKNNYFGSCRARGLLVSTPRPVRIEDNVFESAGAAILMAGDANYWYESGACKDVVIKGNHFSDCCMTSKYQFCEGIISICPEIPEPDIDKPFHRNIVITNNTFMTFDYSVLYALSVSGLIFSDNKIIRSYVYQPHCTKKHMINLEYCKSVKIHHNQYIGEVLGKDIGVGEMVREEVEVLPPHTLDIYEEKTRIVLME